MKNILLIRPIAALISKYILAFILLLWGIAPLALAADYYVRPPGTTSTDASPYNSWDTAATQIQWAVNVAMTNLPAVVWVTNGVYAVTNQVEITNSVTVKSMSGWTNTLVCRDASYTTRIFYVANTGALEGVTVSNGYEVGALSGGGGVYLTNGSIIRNCRLLKNVYSNKTIAARGGAVHAGGGCVVSNCLVVDNRIYGLEWSIDGAGIYLNLSQALGCTVFSNTLFGSGRAGGISTANGANVISNCLLSFNYALQCGGVFLGSGGLVTDCVISNNSNGQTAGGIDASSSSTVRNSVIVYNSGANQVGGIYTGGSGVVISNCVIAWNRTSGGSGNAAGGIRAAYSNVKIDLCQISNNIATAGSGNCGGAFFGYVPASPSGYMRNCVIHHNTNLASGISAGGVLLNRVNLIANPSFGIINCTIVYNFSTNEGGGMSTVGGSNRVINCIISGNTSTSNNYPDVFNTENNSNAFWYCCANVASAPLPASQGNIAVDPELDPSTTWHLLMSSPCVNAGTNQAWMTNSLDLAGNRRVLNGTVDIGAYERLFFGTFYYVK